MSCVVERRAGRPLDTAAQIQTVPFDLLLKAVRRIGVNVCGYLLCFTSMPASPKLNV